MKIALLTDSNVFAGTERHMLDLAVELRALGAEPTLVCPSAGVLGERGRLEGISVLGLEKRTLVDPAIISQLAQRWRSGEFDVMHAHNGRMALHAALARGIAQQGTLVTTQHFLAPARAGRTGAAGLARRVLHGAANHYIRRHIAISHAVGDAMLARHETTFAKLRVVRNGVRDPRRLSLKGREETRGRLNVSDTAPLVVCLARLEPEKGLHSLIDAMTIVALDRPDAVCLIAGHGSLWEALRERLASFQPAPPVRLLGFVDDPLSLLAAADLCVLPSTAEPFGLSLVEAMALGIPVVATHAGGPVEIVQEGVTGRLTLPDTPRLLAAAMSAILTDHHSRTAMGLAARADFLMRFTAERMAREMLTVYHEAVLEI